MKVNKCPDEDCGGNMKKNKHGLWVCEDCGGTFVPENKHSGPDSIFGVSQ